MEKLNTCFREKENTSIAGLNKGQVNIVLDYCEKCDKYAHCNKVAELNDMLKALEDIQVDEKIGITMVEDDAFDVIVNGELEVHIKRNDIGYSVDLYRHATQEEMEDDDYDFDDDFISACTALDDDLTRENDITEIIVKEEALDGSDRVFTNDEWYIKNENLYCGDELMVENVIDDNDEIISAILDYEAERVNSIEVDGKEIYNINGDNYGTY